MYEAFYQFKEKPFSLTPDPEFLYESKAHKRAFAYLEYGIQDPSGFVCITGEIGAGKTTLIRAFLNQLDQGIQVARLFNTRVTSRQLLEMILQDLGMEYRGKTKTAMIEALNQYLIDTFADGRRVVLLIDEAQNLTPELLEEIRLLSNLETEKTKLLQIILVGQSELRDHLLAPNLEQFRQRITVNYHIPPLDRDETAAYIRHRIRVASEGPEVVFPDPVVDVIYAYSRGVPRLINVISDALLLYGFVEEKRQPDEAMVQEVIHDMLKEGTLVPPAPPAKVREGRPAATGAKGLQALERRVAALEQRQTLFVEMLEMLDGLHKREEELARREERLQAREAEVERRELRIRELLKRSAVERPAAKARVRSGGAA